MADLPVRRVIVQGLASINGGINNSTNSTNTTTINSININNNNNTITNNSNIIPCENVTKLPDSNLVGAPNEIQVVKRKRGRPPRNPAGSTAALAAAAGKKPKEEEEDVCFICCDGGSLVLCDHRDCPKAYHPACVKRDEAFFRPKLRWECGWHLCNSCQKNALFMCYTCSYSMCKRCVKQADLFNVRGNKGFCRTCMANIMQIEKIPQDNKEVVQIDFDDKANWEYLFKMYWIILKEKLNLTSDEITGASNAYKGAGLANKDTYPQKTPERCFSNASELSSSSSVHWEANDPKRRKTGRQLPPFDMDAQKIDTGVSDTVSVVPKQPDWASKELLEFVSHMKYGDTSVIPRFDVQALLLDYIRKHNLRDPRQKCQIICDKRLENLFGKDRVGHFEMLRLLEYHFKEESCPNSAICAATMEPFSGPVDKGITGEIQIPRRETRSQSRSKGDDKGRHIIRDAYAAIDGHNINLIYLKRDLLETLTANAENFHDKVVGSVVRIKISSSDQKQDMHRLVRIIGTSKAIKPYKIGEKMENLMLKILNLNNIEDVSIDAISDQEFSEDECRRLRQSIKLGLVEGLTVREIQGKAFALQAVRVDHWLETEIRSLNLLRDRANELGHEKEHREYVEKIELLKTPEERQRRIHEVLEVHADPRMDPSHESDDDSGESDMKRRDGALTLKYPKSHAKSRGSMPPLKVGYVSNGDKVRTSKAAAVKGVRKRKHSTESYLDGVDGAFGLPKSALKTERADAASTVKKMSDTSMINSPGTLSVSDISEFEKIWHYRDPAGKVQGPFCRLQLRKWDSSGFFPSDLRVWKSNETDNRSILLTNALGKQESSEPHFQHQSGLPSHDIAKVDDEKVNSIGAMSSNSASSWVSDQANEECSKSNSPDIATTPEAKEQSVNGYSCQPDSDGQDGAGQFSSQNLKAQLIESLFNIEEPSPEATVNRSPEIMQADLKSDPSRFSMTISDDNVDAKSQTMKSSHSSPDFGTSLSMASDKIEASELPGVVPSTNYEMKDLPVDDELHDKSDSCKDLGASCETGSDSIKVSENKDINSDTINKQCAGYGREQESGVSSTLTGGTNVVVFPSAAQKWDNEGLRSNIAENRPSISSNVSLLPRIASNNVDTKANSAENNYYAPIIPKQDPVTNWCNISGGVIASDLPSNSPKTETDKGPTTSNNPGQESGIRWSNIIGGIEFSDIATSLKVDADASRGVAVENHSWNTTSNLGDEVHLPDVADEWDVYSTVQDKPPDVDFISSLGSCSSAKLPEIPIDQATSASDSCLNLDDFDWQQIELSTFGDDSVSDLLSEVEAMECLRSLSSPTSQTDCADDLISFSPLAGLSLNTDPGKNDASSSGTDIQFDILPSHRDQLHGQFHVDVCNTPLTSFVLSDNNFVSQAPVSSMPPLHPPLSLALDNYVYGAHVSLPMPPPPLPPQEPPSVAQLADRKLPPPPVESAKSPAPSPSPSPSPPSPLPSEAEKPLSPPQIPPVALRPPSPSPSPPSPLPSEAEKPPSPPQIPPVAVKPPSTVPQPPKAASKPPSPPPPQISPVSVKSPSAAPQPPPATAKPPSPPLPLLSVAENQPLPSTVEKPPFSLPPHTKKLLSSPPLPVKLPSPPPQPTPKLPSPPQATEKLVSAPPPTPARKLPSLPPFAKKLPSPPPQATKKVKKILSPPPPAGKLPSPQPLATKKVKKLLSSPSPVKKLPLPPPPAENLPSLSGPPPPPPPPLTAKKLPSPPTRPSTLSLDCPSSPREEGEVELTSISDISVRHQGAGSRDQQSHQTATTGFLRKQGSKTTTNGWELSGGQPNSEVSEAGSILGSPNMHWNNPGQVMPSVGANPHWISQTSPRYSHNAGRPHHNHAEDPGFAKNRQSTWTRQAPFVGGVPSKPPHRGQQQQQQRVCKYFKGGYCTWGASCKYLHQS